GFDLVVLGAVIPELLATQALGFTPEAATLVATLSLVGGGWGAVADGPGVDRSGRRWTVIACVAGCGPFTPLGTFPSHVPQCALVLLGAVPPELLAPQALGFTPDAATLVATLSLVGVGLGAVAVGPVVDRIGRRWTLIACVIGFSLFTLFVAFAPNVALFTLFRFIPGLFLGAVMPSCLAYIGEYSNSGKTGKATTLTMTGYHAGAVAISLLAVAYSHNWHLLFAAGGLAGLLMVPLLWWKLPESEAFRVAQEAKRNPAAASATVTEAIDPAGHVDAK